MSDLREEEITVGSNVPDHQEQTSTASSASSGYHEVASAASPMSSNQEQGSSTVQNVPDDQNEITSAMNLLELESALTPTITVVEALLLSGLNISVKTIIEALQLIEALVDTVSSNQTPPFLKVIKHNVDTNAYAKLAKGKKGSSSGGREDSPEKITPHAACARCQHDPAITEPALTLRSCLNCEAVEYCSVECQLTDWMAHRNLFCINPSVIPLDTLANPHRVPFLKTHITNPFARLAKGIWLHDRHKQDVYALLIDAFRLREADDFTYSGMTNNDSVYSGRVSSCPAFRRFLYQAEAKGLMPPWWSDQKRVECLTKGIDKRQDNYHDLHAMTRDIEIVVVYEDAIMTMQLRMFAESVLGKGAAGSDGRLMLQKMVVAEESARVLSK
ncbi:hypothetical protein THARTR1_08025 [Trichoderma harzianum]|uniref:MYND-type domain-containing protein n=1 Tax=Trichoderma harzianum TaxID=5544 RepID=A0A2K0U0R7_TRIHA|nr:hypothetical protein THARTR1_08025 [Trichoderma harzianum]